MIDLAPLRDAVAARVRRGEVTWDDIARSLDWWRLDRGQRRPDGSRVTRTLGLRPERGRMRGRIGYDLAVRITRAADLDPIDVGV